MGDLLILGDTPRAPARKNSGFLFRETDLNLDSDVYTTNIRTKVLILSIVYFQYAKAQISNLLAGI
jgi:hypothetical protein